MTRSPARATEAPWPPSTASPSRPRAYAASRSLLGGRSSLAVVPVASLDADTQQALEVAAGLARSVVAVHVNDPGTPAADSAFEQAWMTSGPDVALVLARAAHDRIGVEIADYVRHHVGRREVHVVIPAGAARSPGASPGSGPAAQIEQALRGEPHLTVHRLLDPPAAALGARGSG